MKTLMYLSIVLLLVGCNSKPEPVDDPKKDLIITDVKWKRRDPEKTFGDFGANLVSFRIKNSSPKYTYRKIIADFKYLDKTGKEIDYEQSAIITTIKPDSIFIMKDKYLGSVNPKTVSAKVVLVDARSEY